MKRIVAGLVMVVLLIGCLTGCNGKKQQRGGEMPEIPNLEVSCGLKSVDALRGMYIWRYEDEELRDNSLPTQSRQDEMPCLEVSGSKRVTLKFDMEPLDVFVNRWSTDAWDDLSVEPIEVELQGLTFMLADEDSIYEVWARWQGNDSEGGTLSGNVYYSFYTSGN